jgi:hypothetical protein
VSVVTPEGPGSVWRLSRPRAQRVDGGFEVSADLDGAPIWFRSADAELVPTPEAFAAVALLPALRAGARVAVEAPLEADWLAGASELARIFAGWWELPARQPLEAATITPAAPAAARPAGLCFSAGVDSFYELLSAPGAHRVLVFVHGYDLPLNDERRWRAFDSSLRAVADATGTSAVAIRTNLREHPRVSALHWRWTHGSGLAAAGLLLAERVGSLRIGASYARGYLRPWGSHPKTDPLWSTSQVRVSHGDISRFRLDKVRRLAGEPLAQRHLRVCWKHRTPDLNCSRCEKCLRTMTALAGIGALQRFTCFEPGAPLAERLAALERVPRDLYGVWEQLLALELEPDVRRRVAEFLPAARKGVRGAVRRALRRLAD